MNVEPGESRGTRGTGTPIIILGADRSGTTLVAELVSRWGAWGGDPGDLVQANRWNPRGYFEHRAMTEFLLELMDRAGVNPWHPEFPERCREQAKNPELRGKGERLVDAMAGGGRAWFWNQPKLSVLLPFWQPVWGDAVYVIPVRNPYDSARSLEKMKIPSELRERVSIVGANLLRWQHSMHNILTGTEGGSKNIFISYEELLRAPREQCRRLSMFLGEHTGIADGGERSERMAGAVDPKLQNNRSSLSFQSIEEATRSQKDLYEFLLSKTRNPEAPYVATRYPIYPGWREYLDTLDLFSRFYDQAGPLLRSRALRALAWTEQNTRVVLRRAGQLWPKAAQGR